jgi:hypothetical protein
MARKVHSDVKAAVSLIIRENLSAIKDVFTNLGSSESKSLSQNEQKSWLKEGKVKSDTRPEKKPQKTSKTGDLEI